MCGFGAILHGYLNPEIEEAVELQKQNGAVFNQPAEVMVELAESLVENIDFADWAVFAKNGSDLTTWAIRVAREKTQRKFIVKVKGHTMELMLGVTLDMEAESLPTGRIFLSLTGTILINWHLSSKIMTIK